ncbi:MAG: serine/threonine protein kinase [Aggregatilineales bacterium]
MTELQSGMEFAGFILGDLLGEGGMGTVYQGFKPGSNERFAIKLITTDLGVEDDYRKRFEREILVMQSLHHPNIVPIYAYGEDQGISYFVMKMIRGSSLNHLIRRRTFSPADVWAILQPISQALSYAHQNNVIHRDLKPANILVENARSSGSTFGQVYLADFGLSKLIGAQSLTQVGMMVGTPSYMAPEQVLGQPSSAASDIYALGIVVYELLTGKLPFTHITPELVATMQVEDAPPLPHSFREEFPIPIEQVILRALQKAPADRYSSPQAFAEAYADALNDTGAESSARVYWPEH